MKLGFSEPSKNYKSGSQTARDITEAWIAQSMYCPNCGNSKLKQFPPNLPVADFFCARCNDQYELKSQKKEFGSKVANGAYTTKLDRLRSDSSPNLILLKYDRAAAKVLSVCGVPKRFFIPAIVEKRKPLSPSARRAGWIGSNILLSGIPSSGRIYLVQNGIVSSKDQVLEQWQKTAFLNNQSQSARGWLIEVMNCVDRVGRDSFSLEAIYEFEAHLKNLYPKNNNIRPKIRQQLQLLRDNGYLRFLGNGRYQLSC